MNVSTVFSRSPPRRSFALALALATLLALGATAPAAHAGPNGGQGVCFKAYNYASTGMLYASTEGLTHPDDGKDCKYVHIEIGHYSFYHHPSGPGIEGSQCFNAYQISWNQSSFGYTSTAWYGDVTALHKPCSLHLASRMHSYPNDSFGSLLFNL